MPPLLNQKRSLQSVPAAAGRMAEPVWQRRPKELLQDHHHLSLLRIGGLLAAKARLRSFGTLASARGGDR